MQAAHAAQYQKNEQPNQKMGQRKRYFYKEDIHMANKHMKRCSTSPIIQISSVSLSVLSHCLQPHWLHQPDFPVHHQLPELIQTHVHRVSNASQPSHPLSPPSPAFNLSLPSFCSSESVLIRWPKYWSFSFNISPSNEYSGLISYRIDWLDFLAVQGTLTSLLQHNSSKASVLRCSDFFMVQLSHPYMTTEKTIAV